MIRHSQSIGNAFEFLIDYTNTQYSAMGIAIINKRPTPMKIVKQLGARGSFKQFVCVHDKKSTVDYDGVYKGHAVAFEAKTISKLKRFDLSRIADHQLEYLIKAQNQGAVSFLLIEFQITDATYLVPTELIDEYAKAAIHGGVKSIPLTVFEERAYKIGQGRVGLDYLAQLDKMIGTA